MESAIVTALGVYGLNSSFFYRSFWAARRKKGVEREKVHKKKTISKVEKRHPPVIENS